VLGMPTHNWLRLAQVYACMNVIEWYGANPILVMLNSHNGPPITSSRLSE